MIKILENRTFLSWVSLNLENFKDEKKSYIFSTPGMSSNSITIPNVEINVLLNSEKNKEGVSFFFTIDNCNVINKLLDLDNNINIDCFEIIFWNEGMIQIQILFNCNVIIESCLKDTDYIDRDFLEEISNILKILFENINILGTITNDNNFEYKNIIIEILNIISNDGLKEIEKSNKKNNQLFKEYDKTSMSNYHMFVENNDEYNKLSNLRSDRTYCIENKNFTILFDCYLCVWGSNFDNKTFFKNSKDSCKKANLYYDYISIANNCLNLSSMYLTNILFDNFSRNINQTSLNSYRNFLAAFVAIEQKLTFSYYFMYNKQRRFYNEINKISKNKEYKESAQYSKKQLYDLINNLENEKIQKQSRDTQDAIFLLTLLTIFTVIEVFHNYIKDDYLSTFMKKIYRIDTPILTIVVLFVLYRYDLFKLKTGLNKFVNKLKTHLNKHVNKPNK